MTSSNANVAPERRSPDRLGSVVASRRADLVISSSLPSLSWIAAAFCLLISGYMLYQHARASERDPWKAPQLLALKEQLRAAPNNDAIKAEIRRLDLEFRQRYVRRLSLNRTGGWLLVGGTLVVVLAAGRSWTLRSAPWLPKLNPNAANQSRRLAVQARWSVAGVGAVTAVSLLAMAFTTTSPLPRSAAELDQLLRKGDETEASASVPSVAEFQTNWPQFRGFSGSGVTAGAATFDASAATVIWKTPIPAPGFNSPVVWSNRVFLTGATTDKREVFCFDTTDGKLLWQRAVENIPGSPATVPEIPEMTGYAAPTMATDGQRAFAIFPNGDLAALNFDGSVAWSKHLGVPKNMYGYAASLAIWPGKLIVQWDQDEGAPGGSKLFAFDSATGRKLWESTKPTHDSWASPIVIEAAGKEQIITLALPFVMSHALSDGSELWRAELMGGEVAPSALFAGGLVFVAVPSYELVAIRPDGSGDVTQSHVAWKANEHIPDITSPAGDDEFVFTVTTMGGIACYETATGKLVWQKELEIEVQSSPVILSGQLALLGTKGELLTLQVGREFKEISRVKLEDEFHASPAVAEGRMLLRGATNLWCLGRN